MPDIEWNFDRDLEGSFAEDLPEKERRELLEPES